MKVCCVCRVEKPFREFHRSAAHGGYSPKCKPCAIEIASSWYLTNKDRKRAYDAARRAEKRDLYRLASQRFRARNPGAKNADTQRRRAAQRGAMPSWAEPFLIQEIYRLAALRTKITGRRWVVDHVIPLRGKAVSGLHVETNLRVIPEQLNLAKSNHYSMEHEGVK